MRRIPLWLTPLPLVIGLGLYWALWSGWARDFGVELRRWLPDSSVAVTGFPYRLEVNIAQPKLVLGGAVRIAMVASSAQINRGPWQRQLTVIGTRQPKLAVTVMADGSEAGGGNTVGVLISADTALTSFKWMAGRLERLSTVADLAVINLPGLGLTAKRFEAHLREINVAAPDAPSASPAGSGRGQLVIAGEAVRLAGGDALTLNGEATVTGPARLTNYDRWAGSGTIEINSLTLADGPGEVASVRATLVPQGRRVWRLAGTVTTVCPANVAAALTGAPPVSEKRLRNPLRLAFAGSIGGRINVEALPADLASRPVRGQLPPCPVLSRRI